MAKSSFNNVRIQLKNDTSENWKNSTLVLLAGEFAVENDTGLFKIGNGTDVDIAADKSVDIAIPAATSAALGLAQADGSTIEATDGVLSVKAVGISKVFVEEDTELVMNGGNA